MLSVCSGCGHAIGATCSRCSREMLCGAISNVVAACPQKGCAEHVLRDAADDLTLEPPIVEDPRPC